MAEISDLSVTDASNVARWPEGMLGGGINDAGRAMEGYLARWFKDINGGLASSGSSNAFAVTSNRTIVSLVDGIRLTFQANHAITGAATLNLNGIGAKDIKRFNGSALASGDIISGQPVDVIYSLALDDWIMVSALAALVGSTFADFGENAAPGDPAANTGRLYAKDDGAGTTVVAYRDSAGVESVVGGVASAAQMAAAASLIKSVPPGRQHLHPLSPKAWGVIDTAGNVVEGSAGLTAADDAPGLVTVTWGVTFNSATYAVFGTADSSANAERIVYCTAKTVTTATFRADTQDGTIADPTLWNVMAMGTLA